MLKTDDLVKSKTAASERAISIRNPSITPLNVQLNKTGSNNPNDLKAFIVFSDDNKSADIFLPDRIYALLLLKENNAEWHDNSSTYILYNLPEKLSLKENSEEIYYINR